MGPNGTSRGYPGSALMGPLRGLNGAPRRSSMGPLEGPYKREKVKQYVTRDLIGHEVGPYQVARRSRALMGPLEGPMGALTGTLRVSIGILLSLVT
jgi:hypothetical protein